MARKGRVKKKGRGEVTSKGEDWAREGGFSSEWAKGLTDSDISDLEVIADHTDEVIEAIGIVTARALEAIGIQAESDAAKLCPVDTGRLRNSITHTIDDDGKAAIIGTNVEYALYVHEGAHGRKGQPFLTDAITQNQSRYKQIAEAAFKK